MSNERSPSHPKVAVLYSGGKDSNYALFDVTKRGFDVACLISLIPRSADSMLFHYPNSRLTTIQAESLGIPIIKSEIHEGQDELEALSKLVVEAKDRFGVRGVVTGALKSEYQKARFGGIFARNGLEGVNPLWGIEEESYLRKLVRDGFRAIVTRVAALGLGPDWLGVELDARRIEDLIVLARKNRFNASFEGGEGETFVLDMPLFKKRVVVLETEKHWEKGEGTLSIKKAILGNRTADV